MPKPFLLECAEFIASQYKPQEWNTLGVVLPSKRAELFLKRHLATLATEPVLAPKFVTAEHLGEALSSLEMVGSLESTFVLYQAYSEVFGENAESFDSFVKWSNSLMQDFNEIDRYLVDPHALYTNLLDIKVIERWGLQDGESPSGVMFNFLEFWKNLEPIYHRFVALHKANSTGTQGMAFREAVSNLNESVPQWMAKNNVNRVLFIGFNALNAAEEKLVKFFLDQDLGDILWDADSFYMDQDHQEAGIFMKEFKANWNYFSKQPFRFLFNYFRTQPKNIRLIGVPKQIGQAKAVGKVLNELLPVDEAYLPESMAVVLAEESLLLPVLRSVPPAYSDINVTMGLGLGQVHLMSALDALFTLHENARKMALQQNREIRFYHKDLTAVLQHPFIDSVLGSEFCSRYLGEMKKYNRVFIQTSKVLNDDHPLAGLFIAETVPTFMSALQSALAAFHDAGAAGNPMDYEASGYAFRALKSFEASLKKFNLNLDFISAASLMRQHIRDESLSFYGEPLTGLQIMGVLETRLLDFDTIILSSLNEGILPSGKSDNSFIPFDLKKAFGLPSWREKDAIYAYHFYRLIQRASDIHLLYSTESDAFGSGEPSRFIAQIEHELSVYPNITIDKSILSTPVVEDWLESPFDMEKSTTMVERLKQMAENGFSPTALNRFINNREEFFRLNVLGMQEAEEVEENIGYDTLGKVVHKVLQDFYTPYVDKPGPKSEAYDELHKNAEVLLRRAFEEFYLEGEYGEGKNMLVFHVALRMLTNYIKYEKNRSEQFLKDGVDWRIYAVEKELIGQVQMDVFDFPIYLRGFADRIDLVDGIPVVIDYKTGKVSATDCSIKEMKVVFQPGKGAKALQLMAYAWMLHAMDYRFDHLRSGIGAMRNAAPEIIELNIAKSEVINPEMLKTFQLGLEELMKSIFDQSVNFSDQPVYSTED